MQQPPQADAASIPTTSAAQLSLPVAEQHHGRAAHGTAVPLVASAERIRRLLATTLREREPA